MRARWRTGRGSSPAASGSRCRSRCPRRPAAAAPARPAARAQVAALIAPTAVEWLAEASPKLATATRVVGPVQRRTAAGRQRRLPTDRPGHPERAGQMTGDRRGLRDHPVLDVAEDLVPATGDRLVDAGGQATGDVQHPVGQPAAATRPAQVEPAGAVVQQRRVVGTQRQRDGGVGLVARRPDRVEALVDRPHPAGSDVEPATGALGVEQVDQGRRRPGHDLGRGHRRRQVVDRQVRHQVGAHPRTGQRDSRWGDGLARPDHCRPPVGSGTPHALETVSRLPFKTCPRCGR